MKYFIAKANQNIGPLTKEQVLEHQINADTLIWKEGTDNWMAAKEFDEFRNNIEIAPPPLPNEKKKIIAKGIKKIENILGISFLAGLIVFFICMCIFNPTRYQGTDYSKYRSYGNITSIPEGFFDYTDGNIAWNPNAVEYWINERESYLTQKSIRFGVTVFVILFLTLIGYKYLIMGQQWVDENSK